MAIARAVHFGARVLILDEPTSALGVKEAEIVLRYIVQARERGLGVVLISHNVHHAFSVGDTFTILNHGRLSETFEKHELERDGLDHPHGRRRRTRQARTRPRRLSFPADDALPVSRPP